MSKSCIYMDETLVENQELICEALIIYSETTFDFVDRILSVRHRVLGDEIISFDRKLNKML